MLTNRQIKNKDDVIKVVRLYFYRWRVEEYFRSKKQEYEFENMRVRTSKSMNVLNKILTILMGHISILSKEIDRKLLSIKIIERSKSLKKEHSTIFNFVMKNMTNLIKNKLIINYKLQNAHFL